MYRKLSDLFWNYLTSKGFDGTSIVIFGFIIVVVFFFIIGDFKKAKKWRSLTSDEKMETGRGLLVIFVMAVVILFLLFDKISHK